VACQPNELPVPNGVSIDSMSGDDEANTHSNKRLLENREAIEHKDNEINGCAFIEPSKKRVTINLDA
jgi:hypothetical protein